jgi:putative peptide zinc metalloprotease protein
MAETAVPASELERRKHVRIRLRQDVIVDAHKYEGKTFYILKDPVSLRYYRLKENEHFLLQYLDGQRTLEDAQKAYEVRYRPERLKLEDLEAFAQQLLNAGLAQNESPRAGKQLFDRRNKRRRSEFLQAFTNILYIKIPIFDPEWILARMLRVAGPGIFWLLFGLFVVTGLGLLATGGLLLASNVGALHTALDAYPTLFSFAFQGWLLIAVLLLVHQLRPWSYVLFSVALMLGALLLVLTHFEAFRSRLPDYHEFFQFKTVVYLWAALAVVKVIHEFGHGLSCKYFGGEVHEMGFLLLCLSPAMYCNVSDAWTLPSKWKRIIISFAGIYVELVIASIATFVWWNVSDPFWNNLSLSLMIVCSVSTFVFNANPLMRYDGYYVLADWLEIPNLRERSNRYLSNLVLEHCLGVEVQPEGYMKLGRKILFVAYAVISYIYRWVVTFSILWFMYHFLKPYKLQAISSILTVAAAASMVGWPIYRLGKNIYKRGRLPDMKRWRVTLSCCAVAAVLLFIFLVPVPIGQVRSTGVVEVQAEAREQVFVVESGLLEELKVRDGQYVRKDAELAVFRSTELEVKLASAQAEERINDEAMKAKDREARGGGALDDRDRATIKQERAAFQNKRDQARASIETLLRQREKLVLKAPRDGVVSGAPRLEDVGKYYQGDAGGKDREGKKPFCVISEPARFRVCLPVETKEMNRLADTLKSCKPGPDGVRRLEATVRFQGRIAQTWKGEITRLPESEAKEIPWPLSNRGGGPVAVKAGGNPEHLIPQTQQYLVYVDLLDPDEAVTPGNLAPVKVHGAPETCAWWVWRFINDKLDLGLM